METILIAGGTPSFGELVAVTLGEDRYHILRALDAGEAGRLLRGHRPACVILDIPLPGGDCSGFVRAIKADPTLRATTVIVLTPAAEVRDLLAVLAAGADHHLTKPFSPLGLIAAVESAAESEPLPERVAPLAPPQRRFGWGRPGWSEQAAAG
jgi:CheY-like chemotaxis protein